MVNKTFISPSLFSNRDSNKNFSQIVSLAILLIVAIATLLLQNKIIGWEPGYEDAQPKHHGWVSANTLAIISKATPENYFVGYALASRDDENKPRYEYFDRYPVFFSALFNRVLTLAGNLAEKFYLAKQVMNLIFLATLAVAFLIIEKLTGNKALSLAAVLLAFSNPYLLWYKDMVHFDQPALLGFLLLIYAIALYRLDGRKTPAYVCTFVAIGLGRGYASYSILFLWLALEALLILRTQGPTLKDKVKRIMRHPSFILTVLAVVWGASLLSYNIFAEAAKRDVSILQTSILRSARYRLSLNPEFNLENEGVINWRVFVESQVNRIVQWTFPARAINFGVLGNSLVVVGILSIIGFLIWRQSIERRIIYLLLVLSGFGWLIPLRNLSAFHDYTAMYYIGIPLIFFLSLFVLLRPSLRMSYFLAVLALAVYLTSIVQVKAWHEERAGKADIYTYDFVRILENIEGTGRNINMPEQIPYGPFTPGFYLSEHYLSSREMADYVVTRDKKFPANNLTPDNEIIFLFKE